MSAPLTSDLLAAAINEAWANPRRLARDETLVNKDEEAQAAHQARLLGAMVSSGHFEVSPLAGVTLTKAPLVGPPEPELSPAQRQAEQEDERIAEEEAEDEEAQRQHVLAQRQERRDEAAFQREVRQKEREAELAEIRGGGAAKAAAPDIGETLLEVFADAGVDLRKAVAERLPSCRLVAAVDEAKQLTAKLAQADPGDPENRARSFRLQSIVAEINEIAGQLAPGDGALQTGRPAVPGLVDMGAARIAAPGARIDVQSTSTTAEARAGRAVSRTQS